MGKEFNSEEEFMKNLEREELIKMFNEKDQRIVELETKLAEKETRIAELEDKDWYELTIKQLEEQCERLIIERDNAELKLLEKENEIENLKTKISQLETELAESEKDLEIVCVDGKDKIREYIHINCELETQLDRQNKITENLQRENDNLKQELTELKETKAQELSEYLHTSIPKYIVDEKFELLEKSKERIKKLNFYGLSVSTQQSIKISVCHEIDQLIRELNAHYTEQKISKNAQKENKNAKRNHNRKRENCELDRLEK